jgi:glutamate/aspartate transport system permease protein
MNGFDLDVIIRAIPFLWQGMQISLLVTAVGLAGGILLGLILAVMRLSPLRILSWPAAFYVNTVRSIPLILVLFWLYFLVPVIVGRPVGALPSALVAFVLFEAAYYCEIIRAGISSVSRNQILAAKATGLTTFQSLRLVVLPQALRNMAPILLTQAIILFQDTSLVYVITLRDFMTAASIVAGRDGRPLEMYVFAAFVYFVICFAGSLAVRRLQARTA